MRLDPRGSARAIFEGRAPDVAAAEIPPELLELARDLVRLEPELAEQDRDTLIAVVVDALVALEAGSTRLPISDLAVASALLRAPALLSKDPDAYTPLIFTGEHLYLQRMLLLERRFAATFAAKVSLTAPVDRTGVRASLAAVRAHPLPLSVEQAAAVEKAAVEGFTVISGGPGTGKTSIVVALLRVLVRTGIEPQQIALAAPTGKAANRMDDAIRKHLEQIEDREDEALFRHCPKAQTLHRLLGYSPKDATFRHHEENRLAERVVIVDESSMIDLVLMEQLLRSVRPDARLVLLGDAEQLPSVEAGAVLRDIRAAEEPEGRFTVTLEKSFRMDEADPGGRAIMRAARAINAGDEEALSMEILRVDRAEALTFAGVELLDARSEGSALQAFLDRFHRERLTAHREWVRLTRRHYRFAEGSFLEEDRADLEALLSHHSRYKLLAVTRESAFSGASSLNESIHRMVLRELKVPAAPLLPGEPVMMLKNDHERGLFNGDQGAIVSVIADGRPHPMAVFRTASGFEPFHLQALKKDLTLAHAMTVHKSQGSEFDHVAIVLPDIELPILTRELLYTAVTRARQAVTIVGAKAPLLAAIGRRVERHSGLRERIALALSRTTTT